MPIVVSQESVAARRRSRIHDDGREVAITPFLTAPPGQKNAPQVMLVEESAYRNLRTHYHSEDEFQVFLAGGGTNGRHPIQPIQVHFARKFTPYGPILASEEGCTFLTLRTRSDDGAKFLPEARDALQAVEGRKPWQVSADVRFPALAGSVATQPLPGLRDEQGLSAFAIRVAPGAAFPSPDAAATDGQYLVVVAGSVVHQGREHGALSVVYRAPDEEPLEIVAGGGGLDVLALNLPRQAGTSSVRTEGACKVWQCELCGFLYDEAAGLPHEGIAPGTAWEDVPESFGCPDCSAEKADFVMMEV